MSQKVKMSTGTRWEKEFAYSRAIKVKDRILVAGTTAVKDGKILGEGDAYEQTLFVLSIIEDAILKLGASRSDVVRTRIFVSDISKYEEIGKAHGEFFKNIDPVTTLVEVNALVDPAMLVEIEAEAVI